MNGTDKLDGLSLKQEQAAAGRGRILGAVGSSAAAGEVELETTEEWNFEDKLSSFLNPEAAFSMADQLKVIGEFWGKLGRQVVDRQTYIEDLKAGGQAIEAEDGTVWIFAVMDVASRTPRNDTEAGNLHTLVNPIAAPESLLAVQLLHLINGSANTASWQPDFANEAIYELNEDGYPMRMTYAASVAWLSANRQAERIHANFWKTDTVSDSFGVRDAVSGLEAAA